jgi:hypothetical protein
MTEVEQFVRAMVARTGAPVLFRPPDVRVRLLAIPLHYLVPDDEGSFTLFGGPEHPESDGDWSVALLLAYDLLREALWLRVEGCRFVTFTDANSEHVRRIECSVLGLSLLQLALNRAGSGIGLQVWP